MSVQGTVNFGGKATDTAMVTISTDFNETIRADMDAKAALMTIQFGLQRTSPRSQKPGQMNSRGSLVMNMT